MDILDFTRLTMKIIKKTPTYPWSISQASIDNEMKGVDS